MREFSLPFPVDGTAAGGTGKLNSDSTAAENINPSTLTSTFRSDLKGLKRKVIDSATGLEKTIMAVQNLHTTYITLNSGGTRVGWEFDVTDGNYGHLHKIINTQPGNGEYGVMANSDYPSNYIVSRYDWFWITIEGPVNCSVGEAGATSDGPAAFSSTGEVEDAGAGEFILGTFRETQTSAQNCVVIVGDGTGKYYKHS